MAISGLEHLFQNSTVIINFRSELKHDKKKKNHDLPESGLTFWPRVSSGITGTHLMSFNASPLNTICSFGLEHLGETSVTKDSL